MLNLEIRLLTGRYAAATVTDQKVAEWPPEPARLYSALTAALHDDPDPAADEVRALEWLASAGAPEIIASLAEMRQLSNVFVPTNDQRAIADIDVYIERVTAAEKALADTEGKERVKAEKALEKARSILLARSTASAKADGTGIPGNAAEVLNRRLKPQPRWFPVAVPQDDVIHMQWPATPESGLVEALDRVAARVARLGHPSSLVAMRVLTGSVELRERHRWIPSEHGSRFIRIPLRGQLGKLRDAHARHRQVERRVLPADPVRYLDVSATARRCDIPTGVFSHRAEEWIVFEVVVSPESERRTLLDLSLTQQVSRAMRATLLRYIDSEQSPDALTGHRADGGPAVVPHLAYVALAHVGHPHASGSILGLALVPPHDFGVRARDLLLEAIHYAEQDAARASPRTTEFTPEPPALQLTLGRRGVVHVRRIREPPVKKALVPTRWTEPSRRWYTATAVALGRNPGDLYGGDPLRTAAAMQSAERTIATDCMRIGLPEPVAVWIHRRSLLNGAPAAHRFMPFPEQGNGPRRVCVHAEILFDEPVGGPVILGAGRYFGLGLCAPTKEVT